MKKKSSIRLLFLVCSFGFCAVFGIGYYYITNQPKEIYEAELEKPNNEKELPVTDEEPSESMEMVAISSPYEYVLCEEDGYVTVYLADRETLYANTGIRITKLSEELQQEIKEGKPVYSESELYDFLESNSS